MSGQDLSYFRLRAAEERQKAAEATDPSIRAIHLEFADRYDEAASATLQSKAPDRGAITASLVLNTTQPQVGEH